MSEKILFSANDDTGRRIILYEERWKDHIIRADRHPEIAAYLQDIISTVTAPALVCRGNRTKADVYQRMVRGPFQPGKIKVCHVIVDATSVPMVGEVVTAVLKTKWYDQTSTFGGHGERIIRDRRTSR